MWFSGAFTNVKPSAESCAESGKKAIGQSAKSAFTPSTIAVLLIIAAASAMSGCAAKKPQRARVTPLIHISRACLKSMELTDKTYCESAANGPMTCYFLKMDKFKGCEEIKIPGENPK